MFSLLAPWFLLGLGAISVPILVHMIQKERKEVIQFPSLMFLRRIPYQSTRRQKIRHWPLLLLRLLVLLLLIFAFTRPFFLREGGLFAAAQNAGKDVAILLDRSYSMGYGDRWQRAVDSAKAAVDALGGDDRGMVVYFGGEATVAAPLTSSKAGLHAAIDSAQPSSEATRYDVAFRAVQRVFGDTARPHREVVLISDYQRSGWGQRELAPLALNTTLTQVNIADTSTTNMFITQAEVRYLDEKDKDGRERVVVSARLANRGDQPKLKHAVTFEVNGRELQTKNLDLPANGIATVDFDALPVPPGISRATVRAANDSLQQDNAYHFVLARKPSLPVLLVESTRTDSFAGMFVARALGLGERPTFEVERVRSTQLSAEMLQDQALVILSDAPISASVGRPLLDYVENGGGLLVALGPNSESDQWPSVAGELMPRSSGPPVDRMVDHGATFGYLDRGHPIFEVFNGPRSGDFSGARFLRYWSVAAGDDDRQLARFGDSHPALLERRVGDGRVLVWTSDFDALWNDMPLQPVFLPFLRQAAIYAAGYRDERLVAAVGQAVSPAILFGDDAPPTDSAEAARQAATQQQYVAITPSGGQSRFGVPGGPVTLELMEQGFYELKRTTGAEVDDRVLAVNVDVAESDLTPLDPELLAAAVAPRAGEDPTKAVAEMLPRDLERRQSLWWYMLIAALVLLGIEMLWSNRLSRSAR